MVIALSIRVQCLSFLLFIVVSVNFLALGGVLRKKKRYLRLLNMLVLPPAPIPPLPFLPGKSLVMHKGTRRIESVGHLLIILSGYRETSRGSLL